jgi:hypothetical protein
MAIGIDDNATLADVKPEIGEINKYDFRTDSPAVFKARKGVDAEIVAQISDMKKEPAWMREFRLKSLEIFESKPMPNWGGHIGVDFQDPVAGGGGRQQMTHRADAADARCDARHLGERSAFAEFLEAPILRHVEAGRVHGSSRIQVDRDLGVALDTGHWIDRDRAAGGLVGVSCVVRRHELLLQSSAEADLIAASQLWQLAP